jgi:aspartate racemase
MSKFGLIGGLGWQSTVWYYSELNRRMLQRGRYMENAPHIILNSVPHDELYKAFKEKDLFSIADKMYGYITELYNAGCTSFAIACTSVHACLPLIDKDLPIPIIHIRDEVLQRLNNKGCKKVAIIGTSMTIASDIFCEDLRFNGTDVFYPGTHDIARLDEIIFDFNHTGRVDSQALDDFKRICRQLSFCDGIILACTDFMPMGFSSLDLGVPSVDVSDAHVASLARFQGCT